MTVELYKDKDWLYNQYVIEKKSAIKIAKLCDINDIYYWLNKFDIPMRSLSEAQKERKFSEKTKKEMPKSNKILLIND